MKEVFEKIREKLLSTNVDGRCPEFSCWEHSSKDCSKCDLIEIKIRDAIEIVNQVEEEFAKDMNVSTNGWISVEERLPEEKENPVTMDWYVYPVMVQFEDITDIRYYGYGNGHWHHGPSIMDKYVTHWMDIKPYKQEGE